MIWVVNTNMNTCHIYTYQKKPPLFNLLKELSHPVNKLKKGDYLTSDKPGHYKSSGASHGAYFSHTDPKEVEIDNFSREIARELEKGKNDHSYHQLIIIAPSRMNGFLLQHLNSQTKKLIVNNIKKDFQNVSEKDLLSYLNENTKYHD